MKKSYLIAILVVAAIALAAVGITSIKAEEKGKHKPAVLENVTVTGVNYCFGCALKKHKGAKSQCSLHGHQHALKVTGAKDSKGKKIKDLDGWVLHYLATDASEPLMKEGIHGDGVQVKGNVYMEERVIEVISFKPVE